MDLYSILWAFTKMFSFVLVGLYLVPDVFSLILCGTKGVVEVEKGKKTNQYVCSGLTPNIRVEWLILLSGTLETVGVCDPYPESGDAGVCQIRILNDIFILERSPLNSTLTVNDQIPMSKIVFTDGLMCQAINTSTGTLLQTASCNTDFISANQVNKTTVLIASVIGSTLVLLFGGVACLALMIRRYRGQRRREETGPGETRIQTETGEAIIENCLYVTSSNDNESNEENPYAEIEPEEEISRESTMPNHLQ